MPIRRKTEYPLDAAGNRLGIKIVSPIIDDDDAIHCACGNTWLEMTLVQQFPKDHMVILGQKPVPVNEVGFWLFRCPKCNDVMEPNVQTSPTDAYRTGYNKFLDVMEKPDDTMKRSGGAERMPIKIEEDKR